MKRLTLIMTCVGMTLILTSAFALLWSSYAQKQEQRAWYTAFPELADHHSSDSPKRSTSTRSLSGSSPRTPSQEAPVPAFARLFFPRLDQEAFVFEGATSSNLSKGPAWLTATGRPGSAGNCVIAGHRDSHFRFLKDVKTGDEITLQVPPRTYHYRVRSLQVVEPTNVRLLGPERRPVLTLVTCYPFTYVGLAPRRFIVRAELVNEILAQQNSN
jgi:LPXTG-site transpeptidase (sortase) family protein